MARMEVRSVVVGPFVENVWVVWCPKTKEGIVIDPGFEPERVLDLIAKEGVKVREVIATHGHIDHVWGAVPLCKATGAPFRMHRGDQYWLDALERQAETFGLEPPPATPVIDREIADGDAFAFGRAALKAIHTPGHTPGSVCLHDGEGTLFSGDLLFQGSIGRTDFPGGDFPTIVRSIRERVFALDPGTVVLPGHGPETSVADERAMNPFVGDRAGEGGAPGGVPSILP